jgi:hypothetical protein
MERPHCLVDALAPPVICEAARPDQRTQRGPDRPTLRGSQTVAEKMARCRPAHRRRRRPVNCVVDVRRELIRGVVPLVAAGSTGVKNPRPGHRPGNLKRVVVTLTPDQLSDATRSFQHALKAGSWPRAYRRGRANKADHQRDHRGSKDGTSKTSPHPMLAATFGWAAARCGSIKAQATMPHRPAPSAL